MMADDRPHLAAATAARRTGVADDRMLAHHARLLRIELAALEQHAVGHGDLADVVEKAAALERREVRLVEAERAAQRVA